MPPPGFHDAARLDRFLPGPEPAAPGPDRSLSLADLPAMAWRQRWILVGIGGMGLLIGLLLLLLTPPHFRAEATVRIDNEPARILEGQDLSPAVAAADTLRHLNTQVATVTSRSLAAEVADGLAVDRSARFWRATGFPRQTGATLPPARRGQAIAALQAGVAMHAGPDSRVATIAFTSRDPAWSVRIANAYAERYVERTARERSAVHAYARRALAGQAGAARVRLLAMEQAAIAYARRHQLIHPGGGAGDAEEGGVAPGGGSASLAASRLSELNRARASAQATRIAAEARWAMARARDPLALPQARDNAVVHNLEMRRAALAADLAQLRARYREGRPEVQEKAAELRQVEGSLAATAAGLAASLAAELDAARAAEQGLTQATAQLTRSSLDEQERQLRLDMLLREVAGQRRQLDTLLARLNQVEAASDLSLNTVTLLDRAMTAAPAGSPPLRTLALTLAVGMALALLAAVLREAMDDTLRDPDAAERQLGLRLLGTTPRVSAWTDQGEPDAGAEACAAIQTGLDHRLAGLACAVVQVVDSRAGDGAPMLAIGLARSWARAGQQVLLVDAEWPQSHGAQDDATGFSAALGGEVPLESAIVTEPGGLHRLPSGPGPADSLCLLGSGRLSRFLAEARALYDVVVIASRPVSGSALALLIAREADGVVLSLRADRTGGEEASRAVRALADAGGTLIGFVFTEFDRRATKQPWLRPAALAA